VVERQSTCEDYIYSSAVLEEAQLGSMGAVTLSEVLEEIMVVTCEDYFLIYRLFYLWQLQSRLLSRKSLASLPVFLVSHIVFAKAANLKMYALRNLREFILPDCSL
jgi:hypothetical protein